MASASRFWVDFPNYRMLSAHFTRNLDEGLPVLAQARMKEKGLFALFGFDLLDNVLQSLNRLRP